MLHVMVAVRCITVYFNCNTLRVWNNKLHCSSWRIIICEFIHSFGLYFIFEFMKFSSGKIIISNLPCIVLLPLPINLHPLPNLTSHTHNRAIILHTVPCQIDHCGLRWSVFYQFRHFSFVISAIRQTDIRDFVQFASVELSRRIIELHVLSENVRSQKYLTMKLDLIVDSRGA